MGVCALQAGGALIGPHCLGIIQDVEGVRHLAELGVVFLLFNIGLELSLERLRSMQKYVFGMGTAQVRLSVESRVCVQGVEGWGPLQQPCSILKFVARVGVSVGQGKGGSSQSGCAACRSLLSAGAPRA